LTVGLDDLLTVESNAGASNATYAQGSIDYTGNVDETDLFGVEANFGATRTAPPTTPGSLVISNDGTDPQTTLDINWSPPANTNPNITLQSYKIQRSTGEEQRGTQMIPGGRVNRDGGGDVKPGRQRF
jgi:hypothetical protein